VGVLNPAEAFDGRTDLSYKQYVEHDLDLLSQCHAIALLPGWDSDGARGSIWEEAVARKLYDCDVYDAEGQIPTPEEAIRIWQR
jgi:hypothetical protein